MNRRLARLTFIALCALGLVGLAAVLWLYSGAGDALSGRRYDAGETEVSFSNLSGSGLLLYRAGNNLKEAASVPDFNGSSLWLPRGNYFLEAGPDKGTRFYPVALTGYRSGPDHDGSFGVTIRTPPFESPPRLSISSPTFAYIPNGSFLMGNRLNPQEPHQVWLTSYYIAAFEVTNEEFRAFLDDHDGYRNDSCWSTSGRNWRSGHHSQATALLKPEDPEYRRFGQPDQPVVQVNWHEAYAYCKWLTLKLGGRKWMYSLPNEAEWEKAARGPDSFDYALGNIVSDAEAGLYNWRKNPGAEVTVIGSKESLRSWLPNRYGLFHMTGNASEWTLSAFRSLNRQNPYMEDDRNRPDLREMRVVRGGSWYSASIASLSIAYRESFSPEISNPYLGFRIVARMLD